MKHSISCNLKRCDGWVRLLYMVVIFICYSISKMIVAAMAAFQIIMFVFTRSINTSLRDFGQNLSTYHYQVVRFLTFNAEKRPFPFSDWPNGLPDLNEEDETPLLDSNCCGQHCSCHCQTDTAPAKNEQHAAEATKPASSATDTVLNATVVDEAGKPDASTASEATASEATAKTTVKTNDVDRADSDKHEGNKENQQKPTPSNADHVPDETLQVNKKSNKDSTEL
ncbi:MAG: DUF4389 domain-containing protein [Mariprofundaceae bacterium]|nr:DUF4389 domain-containing protein [Mariprofundaceae bacterium]